MKFVVAGGGVAGLAASLAVARAGHQAVVLERDVVDPKASPERAFDVARRGIPHYFQPHAFLPRGRRSLSEWAPDVLDMLLAAGADPQDLARKLRGSRQEGDEDLVYLWVRRPVIEWALRRAAAADPSVEIRAGVQVTGLLTSDNGSARADGVVIDNGKTARSTTAATSSWPSASNTSTRRCWVRAATSGTWASTRSAATTGPSP
jgi:2-polyprenyl-6-methoxyphenol hydroxylase-like FAD-dependent oxidoreductase